MVEHYSLKTADKGVTGAFQAFLAWVLESQRVDALLVPCRLPSGNSVAQVLVGSPEMLDSASPLAPVMPVSSARIVSDITKVAPAGDRLGVLLRPCELRALVELVKLQQARLDNLVLIGIDCFGTYRPNDYEEEARKGSSPLERLLGRMARGEEDPLLREACQVCEHPFPTGADVTVGLWGMELEEEILLLPQSSQGEELLKGLEPGDSARAEKREEAIAQLVKKRIENRDRLFQKTLEEAHGPEKLLAVLSRCVNCHNCRRVCPLCYCRECFFDSPTFEWEADRYLDWARRRGALRMPTDTLLFHLTRMNHVAACCVGCGLCSDACPNDVPVFPLFRLVAARTQEVLGYVPGRSLEDELPLSTFREAEFEEVGR